MKHHITITADGIYAGHGTYDPTTGDLVCDAVLGGSQESADAAYDAIVAELAGDAIDGETIVGDRCYGWTLAPSATSDYRDYILPVSRDPSYYGSECSTADAHRIADRIGELASAEFPGLNVETYAGIGPAGVRGPVPEVCEIIQAWVAENWTAAL